MAKILSFTRRAPAKPATPFDSVADLTEGFSLEVMPRTAAKIADFRAILPAGTRVYVAHIDGVPFKDMLATASRIAAEGFAVMPHFPARGIRDAAELESRISAYAEAGVRQALVLAGGIDRPVGDYADSMQLLASGLFDRYGFTDLHVAGHPEGNRDIDRDGGEARIFEALRWKSDFQAHTDARMALTTQFCFEAAPVVAWTDRMRDAGITLPVHLGIAGPAKLQTMIKFAMNCGVGPSVRVLQRRAADLTKLLLPFEPTELLAELAAHKAAHPDFQVEKIHFFPLGGIATTTEYLDSLRPGRVRAHA